jgi:hypothetical protein
MNDTWLPQSTSISELCLPRVSQKRWSCDGTLLLRLAQVGKLVEHDHQALGAGPLGEEAQRAVQSGKSTSLASVSPSSSAIAVAEARAGCRGRAPGRRGSRPTCGPSRTAGAARSCRPAGARRARTSPGGRSRPAPGGRRARAHGRGTGRKNGLADTRNGGGHAGMVPRRIIRASIIRTAGAAFDVPGVGAEAPPVYGDVTVWRHRSVTAMEPRDGFGAVTSFRGARYRPRSHAGVGQAPTPIGS